MKRINLTEKQIIDEFNNGKVIRTTCGIWNTPNKDGEIVQDIESLKKFYYWAANVDVYESNADGIDYDLIGASCCDMF